FITLRRPPSSTLSPYTTLFRSARPAASASSPGVASTVAGCGCSRSIFRSTSSIIATLPQQYSLTQLCRLMTPRLRLLVLLSALSLLSASLAAQLPRDLDAYITRVMHDFEVPGIAIAIVQDGRVLLAK